MSSEQQPFTSHQQVVNYLATCRETGMEMRNHKFYINNKMGHTYYQPKDPVIQDWVKTNQISIWMSVRGGIHNAVVDQWSNEDQLELEMDLKEYLGDDVQLAIAAAQRAQQLAEKLVGELEISRQIELDGWVSGLNNNIEDTTPLLGDDTMEDTSWMGLRRRLIGM